ncbi:uncharacterized protein LOC121255089 [Juglans microcarpa x Juglans regia]|uniref:uncharacterized protein LOC121255089 n=1 Tax=Juglans microcarpa x Juglans regia TaxID=2249226 RepID=UPI001B7E16B5|nr:uncharacterized protein LOC121255089 [Juglans microcarpa x Juglans regia]
MVTGQYAAPRAPQVGCTLEQFSRQHSPTFDGRLNAMDANSWIECLEQIFEALFCTDDQKVIYATYNLTDLANKWWKSTQTLLQNELGEGVPITWERFKEVFLDRFFPQSLQESRARQFMDLTQGTMTVDQYATKFMELSRYASYLIPDEEKKAEKFERGLDWRIRDRVRALKIQNFFELVNRATIVEEGILESIKYNNQKKRQQQSQPLQSAPNKNKRPHRDSSPGPQIGGQTYPTCSTCGRKHMGKCLYGQNVCFKCRKPNHLARDCPMKKSGEPGKSGGQKMTATTCVYSLTPDDAVASNDVVTGRASAASKRTEAIIVPEWKWEDISMDFILGLPRTSAGKNSIRVVLDRLTNSAHFLPITNTDSMKKLSKLYVKEIVWLHGVTGQLC